MGWGYLFPQLFYDLNDRRCSGLVTVVSDVFRIYHRCIILRASLCYCICIYICVCVYIYVCVCMYIYVVMYWLYIIYMIIYITSHNTHTVCCIQLAGRFYPLFAPIRILWYPKPVTFLPRIVYSAGLINKVLRSLWESPTEDPVKRKHSLPGSQLPQAFLDH